MNRDDLNAFLGACVVVFILLCAAVAFADEPKTPPPYDCPSVKAFVAEHGKVRALALALENGATWKQIWETRRRCKI